MSFLFLTGVSEFEYLSNKLFIVKKKIVTNVFKWKRLFDCYRYSYDNFLTDKCRIDKSYYSYKVVSKSFITRRLLASFGVNNCGQFCVKT